MLEDDKEFFYADQTGKQSKSKKGMFEFKLDDDITKEFRHHLPER